MKRLLAGVACAAAVAACAKGQRMDRDEVTAALAAESKDGRVLVHMRFENHSAHPVWVPAAVAEDEELLRREFDVSADGVKVDYIGPMIKRGPFTVEDYVQIAPRAQLAHTIDISKAYAWPAGSHRYTIRWEGGWLADITRLDRLQPVTPATATFQR